MRTPTRKLGKYSHLKPDPHISEQKFNELKSHLERLQKYNHPKAAKEVQRLAEMGDFSENAAYQMAKGRLRGINKRIDDIKDHLSRAIIIKTSNNTTVQLGNTITVKIGDKQKTYTILGSSETDPLKGIISHNSPIGSALMSRKVGDKVEVQIGDRVVEYEIVKIE